jgi:hypothetical protein
MFTVAGSLLTDMVVVADGTVVVDGDKRALAFLLQHLMLAGKGLHSSVLAVNSP